MLTRLPARSTSERCWNASSPTSTGLPTAPGLPGFFTYSPSPCEPNCSSAPSLPSGRAMSDSLDLFRPFAGQVGIQPDVTHEALVAAYREADLFVFPSVAEGFGQVLLEELACGLPILSTTHTAAPDLIGDGLEGWIVPPARPDLLAERIAWTCTHRDELATMRSLARSRAEEFTWSRFREGIATAFSEFVARQARHV